ncbi:MAG: hypothetical protein SVR04_11030 [Spirochaetota bacterium]|nr:hypothetical protein [Spirochaetota bacterium]
MNGKMKVGVVLMVVLLCITGNLAAQEAPFVEQLRQRLADQDWTEGEIREMVQAARRLNWEDTDPESAEIVALALQLGRQERTQLEGAENAQLALELAMAARQMRQAGIAERDIARTCLESTREMLQEREQLRAQDQGIEPGEQLQERIRNMIQNRIRTAAKEQIAARGANANRGPRGPEAPLDGLNPTDLGKK